MDPISMIVAALVSGLAAGVKSGASQAVTDGYQKLKSLLGKHLSSAKAQETLADHAADPETYDKPLRKVLKEAGADQDPLLLEMARKLLAETDPEGAARGKYTVGHAVQSAIGDHATVNIGGRRNDPDLE
jgi:hypothetical protein